jgi:signal transduction histidine kinase
MHRAFSNIFSNSLAFLPTDAGSVTVTVDDVPSMLPPKGYDALLQIKHISVKIKDTGIGMSSDYLRRGYFRSMSKHVSTV